MQVNPQSGPLATPPDATSTPPGLRPVHAPEEPKRSYGWLIGLAVTAALAGGAYWLWNKQQEAEARQQALVAAIRTAPVESGSISRTLRVTGVTSAERFVSLVTPQIRGSRSGRNRSGFSLAGMDQIAVAALPASTGGGSTPGAASSSGSSSTGGSMATLGASSRISTPRPPARTVARSSTVNSSSALGATGLGSTAGELGSGLGAPGGGPGDFTLVIQELTKPGALVRKGDTIAEFDRQYMLQRLEDYKSTFDTAKALLAQQKANIEMSRYVYQQNIAKAKAALDKAQLDMKTVPVLSDINAERAKLALEEAELGYKQQLAQGKFVDQAEKAELKFAELEFRALEIEYKRTEQNADKMISKSPMNGMAVIQNTFRGSEWAQIQAGDQVYPGQFFMQVVDPKSMIINATVNQVDADRLRLGMKSRVRFDAYPGLEVSAHVVNIAAVPKTGGFRASFVREIPVRLKIDEMDPRIIPDLSCSVDVILEEQSSDSIVPLSGVQTDAESGKHFVYIKNGEAWLRRDVEVSFENYLMASVRGLKKGEVIALDPPPVNAKV